MRNFEALSYYIKTRYIEPVEKDEVYNALDFNRWKTREEIMKAINQKRGEIGMVRFEDDKLDSSVFAFMQDTMGKLTYLLRYLMIEGSVEGKSELELTSTENAWSGDEDIKDPERQEKRIKARKGNERYVYRRIKDGHRLDDPSRDEVLEGLPAKI